MIAPNACATGRTTKSAAKRETLPKTILQKLARVTGIARKKLFATRPVTGLLLLAIPSITLHAGNTTGEHSLNADLKTGLFVIIGVRRYDLRRAR